MNSTTDDQVQHLNNSKGILPNESIPAPSNSNASLINSTIDSFANTTVEQLSDNKSLTDKKYKITLGNGEIINTKYEITRSNYSPNNTEIQDARKHNNTIYGVDVTNTISNATNRVNSTMIYYVPYDKLPLDVVKALENEKAAKSSSPPSTMPVSLNKFSEFTLKPTSTSAVFSPVSPMGHNLIYVQENPGSGSGGSEGGTGSDRIPSQNSGAKEGWALFKSWWDYGTDTVDVIEKLYTEKKLTDVTVPKEFKEFKEMEKRLDKFGKVIEGADWIFTIPDLLKLISDVNKDIAELDRFLELVNDPACNIDAQTIEQLSSEIRVIKFDAKAVGTLLGLYTTASVPAPPYLGQVLDTALDEC